MTSIAAVAFFAFAAAAEPGSNSPYIDSLKKGLPVKEGAEESYTEKLKRELGPDSREKDSYTERLKRHEREHPPEEGSYIESEKARLGPGSSDSAIQAVHDGRSTLKPRKPGDIHHAGGFRLGAGFSRQLSAAADFQAATFESVYGDETKWVPELTLFYEYQPFHSEWFGNFGIVGMGGLGYYSGRGRFSIDIPSPSGSTFGLESRTEFRFVAIPVFVGLNYRFNLLRIVRPYVQAGPSMYVFYEARNDGGPRRIANSRGGILSGGVNFLLDWISPSTMQGLYLDSGVKHMYLTVDYSRSFTFSGPVELASSVFSAGMTYEF